MILLLLRLPLATRLIGPLSLVLRLLPLGIELLPLVIFPLLILPLLILALTFGIQLRLPLLLLLMHPLFLLLVLRLQLALHLL